MVSRNVYWLSTTEDIPDHDNGTWYYTPTQQMADYRALNQMPAGRVAVKATREASDAGEEVVRVTLQNPGATLAFFLRAEIAAGAGADEVLPVRWDDNYVTLVAGEGRELVARYRRADLQGAALVLRVSGWNVASTEVPVP